MNDTDEIEVTCAPDLTPAQEVIVDLHSVINLIGVLLGSLELLQAEGVEGLGSAIASVNGLSQGIKSAAAEGRLFEITGHFGSSLAAEIEAALARCPDVAERQEVKEIWAMVSNVLEVFQSRIEELRERMADPRAWRVFSAKQLAASLERVLAAIEQNARGRYRIVKNIAEQTPRDYQVSLAVSSCRGDDLPMPPVLQDVFRDIIANARKYTQPGGNISAGLHFSEDGLRLVVEDNGLGIPRDELENVVRFGFRASNVKEKRTLGGGFGLTKAFWVTKFFGGRMWIRSRMGYGTRVTIFIPPEVGVSPARGDGTDEEL